MTRSSPNGFDERCLTNGPRYTAFRDNHDEYPIPQKRCLPVRILYGVVGEGMGHAMRSMVILEALVKQGHECRIVASGKASAYLEHRYPGQVTPITGLTMVYENNVIQKMKTALKNLKSLKDVPDNFRAYAKMARTFCPDLVISDFESWTYWFARGQRIPVISLDNIQMIDRCEHDSSMIGPDKKDFLLAKSLVRAKLPSCNAYLITTFFYPRLKKDRTSLHPPILRPVIMEQASNIRTDEHVLVYQSGSDPDGLIEELKGVGVPFRAYGLKPVEKPVVDGNLTLCPFSEQQFIEDLTTARAVIASSGFTLMGESIFLGKPLLTVPLVGQFEQSLNARYLAKLGYGELCEGLTKDQVRCFLERSGQYEKNLRSFQHDKNQGLLLHLEHTIKAAVEEGSRGID